MRIPNAPSAVAPLLTLAKNQVPTEMLRAGVTLKATVVDVPPQGTTLKLDIGGRLVHAESVLPLPKGQVLQLRVESDGGRLLLRVLDGPARDVRMDALRTLLPKLVPLDRLLEPLQTYMARPPTEATERTIHRAVSRLLESLPDPKQLSRPEGVERAFRNSGLFLESRLLAADPEVASDFKGQLLRLLAILQRHATGGAPAPSGRPAPAAAPAEKPLPAPLPDRAPTGKGDRNAAAGAASRAVAERQFALLLGLLKQVESTIARLQTHQLTSGSTPERSDESRWLFELPIRHGETLEPLRIHIRREGARRQGGADRWSVVLRFSPREHGEIRIVVTLIEGTVSTRIQTERETTAALFERHLEALRDRLTEQGLRVGQLLAHVGIPEEADDMPAGPMFTGLVNERA